MAVGHWNGRCRRRGDDKISGGTNTVQTTLPDWLQSYLPSELSRANAMVSYATPQSLVAPMNSAETQGLQSIQQAANGVNPSASAANANAFETSGALLDPSSNPYLQNTFTLASNSIENNLDSQFAGAGSSVINSLPVQSDQLNNLATQLYGGAYQQGLNTMTQASALAPTIQQGTYLPGQELYQAGSSQQQQAQNLINAPYNALSWYSGLLGLNGSSMGGSSSSNNGAAAVQDAGLGIGALGALAEIAPMFASMSDRRAKTDIRRVGELPSGLPLYSFRYQSAPEKTHIGVMADEAEKLFPEAVIWHRGFQHVDYSKIQ